MKKENLILALIILAAVFSCGADTKNADAKKAKHNYKTANFLNISGDQTNADADIVRTSSMSNYHYYYRKIAVPGLKVSDPLPFQWFKKNSAVAGFSDENWGSKGGYFITDGYLWMPYGYMVTGLEQLGMLNSDTGDYRLFSYYGGKDTKKTKRNCGKIFNFNVSGDATNADAAIAPYSFIPNSFYYYRRISLAGLKTANMPGYRIYKKNSFYSGLNEESWSPTGPYFFADGAIWIAYGVNGPTGFVSMNEGDFRLCLYDKNLKNKGKKYAKRYIFSVSGDENNSDMATTTSTIPVVLTSYYRKIAIAGLKMSDESNLSILKKNEFVSGFSEDSFSPLSTTLYMITDGYLYIQYEQRYAGATQSTETGEGDYRVFVYK
jgi:hypothetical protein